MAASPARAAGRITGLNRDQALDALDSLRVTLDGNARLLVGRIVGLVWDEYPADDIRRQAEFAAHYLGYDAKRQLREIVESIRASDEESR